MKVLIVSALYPPVGMGGAEKAASLLAESLVRAGDEVVVVTLHSGMAVTHEERNGVRVYRLPIANAYWPFGRQIRVGVLYRILWHARDLWNSRAAKQVARILDVEDPDVVHTHVLAGFSIAIWNEIKKRNIRLVHTMHDYYLLCMRSSMFRNGRACERRCLGCKMGTLVRKRWSNRLDEAISVSEYVLKTHKKSGYLDGVSSSVVYNVMDSQGPASGGLLDPEPMVFGYIGKIEEAKGIQVVLEAIERLSHPNWRLRIAGSGFDPYVRELKARYSDSRIEWLGFVTSQEFYRSIDVSVIPSIWADPLPYVVIETLVAGKSLICSNAGGIPEIARLGSVVKVVQAGDVPALAEAMDDALANGAKWSSGGFKAPEMVSLFSEEMIVGQHSARYAGVK